MSITWLGMFMSLGWCMTLVGGLGSHVLEHFDGRKLEAYCRLKRRPERFGEILDNLDRASIGSQYLLLFGLVFGSLAAGGWFFTTGEVQQESGRLISAVGALPIVGWVTSWVILLMLAGLWLPRIVVRYSSAFFLFHSWWFWNALSIVTEPFSYLGNLFAWLGRRLSDAPQVDEKVRSEEEMEDEIRTIVTTGRREGVFKEGVQEMIVGVMELDDADVEQIMTPRSLVDAIDVESSWEEVVGHVANCGRTRIPVYRDSLDNIIGLLYSKDLLSVLADPQTKPGAETLKSILRQPWFIPGSKRVDDLLRVFLHNRNHMAIVVDPHHQLLGVVTIEDALEEIVGEISDELDIDEESEIIYDELNHRIEAQGKVPIEEIDKALGVELPESDDYDTIGGLIVHRLSEIPAEGTSLNVDEVKITVLRASARAVLRVQLELISEPNQED